MRSKTPALHYSITPLAVLAVSMIHNDLTLQHSITPALQCPACFVLRLFLWKAVVAPLLRCCRFDILFIKVFGPVQIRVLLIYAGSSTDAVGVTSLTTKSVFENCPNSVAADVRRRISGGNRTHFHLLTSAATIFETRSNTFQLTNWNYQACLALSRCTQINTDFSGKNLPSDPGSFRNF